jgi:cell division septation protein DedD
MPLIFGMVWIPLKTDLLKNINYSGLNPFASKEVAKPVEHKDVPKSTTILPAPSTNKDSSEIAIENKATVTETFVEPVKPDTTRVVTTVEINSNNKFHVVAGCFKIEDNAIKFVALLQQQNINASIIGQNDKGLFVVSCGDFQTRKEANDQLDTLRKSQPNAWLYKN